jgi:hypothetical protein
MGSAVQLNEEGEHTLGNQPYQPVYPVYNFNNNGSSFSNYPQQGLDNSGFSNEAATLAPGSISDSAIIQKY